MLGWLMPLPPAQAAEPVRLLAAGSLRAAFTELLAGFRDAPVEAEYGPSGLLRHRIEAGAPADLFASADLGHPRALGEARGRPYVLFARNRLCALAAPGVVATPETLLDNMLDPAVRLGTSTPRADPSGDYAWAAFARAEALRPGAKARLEAKAIRLVGALDSPAPPPGEPRSTYGWLIAGGAADLFLTYCTNAVVAAAEVPGARMVPLPPSLATGAEYGLILLDDRPEAARLALHILSPAGQAVLARHGFEAPLAPR
ncbi:molybdate ABC transporter substrate-binding protein [Dankookia sp. P2]|uniref:molybdate ABC transporter substrate-binding protein n=1 Tax=Dankookia sp. P2 TaxID=3423955 RepID=UPI003D67EABE